MIEAYYAEKTAGRERVIGICFATAVFHHRWMGYDKGCCAKEPIVDNVRYFRSPSDPEGGLDQILSAAMYVVSGWWLWKSGSGSDWGLFILLGIFYWVFIHRRVLKTSMFFRFHYLQALFLFLALSFALTLLGMVLVSLGHLVDLLGLTDYVGSALSDLAGFLRLGVVFGIPVLAGTLALLAGTGRKPRIPWITDNANHFA